MKPEDFRQLLNKVGTPIGLIGEYGGPSDWSRGEVISGTLKSYVVVERQDPIEGNRVWDAAAIIQLNDTLTSVGLDAKTFVGKFLLLLHRYPEFAWDNKDPNVYVYGFEYDRIVDSDLLKYEVWAGKAILLSSAAIMMIEDPLAPSEVAQAFQNKRKRQHQEE